MTDHQPPQLPPGEPQEPYAQQPQRYRPPPQQHRPPGPPPSHRGGNPRRHGASKIILGVFGVIVVIIIITAVASNGRNSPNTPAGSSSSRQQHASSPAAAPPAPHVPQTLINFSGSGIRNSAPFTVGSGPVTVHYSYDCSSNGSEGNFSADLLYGNQSSLNSDDQPIANELGTGGSQTTTVYPQDPGQRYYLSVDSECSWSVKVSQ